MAVEASPAAAGPHAITPECIACLAEMLEFPRRHTQRCVEQISFLDGGGQRWTRSLQIQVPLAAEPGARWRVVSLGMFQRRRFPDLEVRDAADARVNLVTRRQHGVALTHAVLAKYLRPFHGALDGLDPADPAGGWAHYAALVDGTYELLTSAGDIADPTQAATRLAMDYRRLLTAAGVDRDRAREAPAALASDLAELQGTTQYLCWVRAEPGEVCNLRATYTTPDARRGLRARAGDSSRTARLMRGYRRCGLAPLNYAFPVPSRDHAGSYYFTLRPPEKTSVTYVDWGSGNSFDDPGEVSSALPGVHLHHDEGAEAVPHRGGLIHAFMRCNPRDHKKIAAGALLNAVFVFLVATGRFTDKIGGSAQTWLLVTPTVLTAYIADQQRHYYAYATRRQRGILWAYLAISVAFLVATSFSLASGSAGGRAWGLGATIPAWALAIGSAAVFAWYAPLGRTFDRFVRRRAVRAAARGADPRRAYEKAVLRHASEIVALVALASAAMVVALALVWSHITGDERARAASAAARPAPAAARTYPFRVRGTCATARCLLSIRSGPGLEGFATVRRVPEGAPLRVVCRATGERVAPEGAGGAASATWDRLAGGGWVSDLYVAPPPGGRRRPPSC